MIKFRLSAAEPHVKNRYSDHHKHKSFPVGIGSMYGGNMGFTIEYEVKMMRTVGDAIYFYDFDENDKPYKRGDQVKNLTMYKIIDYTLEREDVFKELYERFDKMLISFIDGFTDAEKFIDAIPTTKLLSK